MVIKKTHVKFQKEFPNPVNIQKRMKLTNKILSIKTSDGGTVMEVEFEKEPSEEEKRLVINYFKNNPYWKEIKN